MNLRRCISFLLPLLLSIDGETPSFAASPEQSDYLPVKEGVEWIMDAVVTPSKGEAIQGTGHRKLTETVQRDGKAYLRSHTIFEADGHPSQEFSKLVRKDATGFYSIDEKDLNSTEQLEIPLPLVVGNTWEYITNGVKRKGSVIGLETIAIGKNTYKDCYHIRAEALDGSVTEDFWEAPKLGSIKSVAVFSKQGDMVLTLREFKAGKE
ncbi:MAG TPA: hypothetical protein VGH90_07665 [Chthoniobacteraceae bacterium]|jgi:hypothetical protein